MNVWTRIKLAEGAMPGAALEGSARRSLALGRPGTGTGATAEPGRDPADMPLHGSLERPARIAVIYYSAGGNVHALARGVADGAASEGADVRLRHVAELSQEMVISANQYWGRHRSESEDQPDARLEDIEWADGIAFGTPTRFGNVSAQLKVFLDLAGELWQKGKLVDKVGTAFTSSQTEHGGQESTILALNNTLYHWGAIVLPLGYTVHEVFNGGGNPYGASFTSDHRIDGPAEETLVVARAQGARLARVARVIGAAREADLLTARAAPSAASISSITAMRPSSRRGVSGRRDREHGRAR
jgi:NAD(P)H dehydrogenase (quinone)